MWHIFDLFSWDDHRRRWDFSLLFYIHCSYYSSLQIAIILFYSSSSDSHIKAIKMRIIDIYNGLKMHIYSNVVHMYSLCFFWQSKLLVLDQNKYNLINDRDALMCLLSSNIKYNDVFVKRIHARPWKCNLIKTLDVRAETVKVDPLRRLMFHSHCAFDQSFIL